MNGANPVPDRAVEQTKEMRSEAIRFLSALHGMLGAPGYGGTAGDTAGMCAEVIRDWREELKKLEEEFRKLEDRLSKNANVGL